MPTTSMRALSGEAALLESLQRGCAGRLHSVFARALNVVTDDGGWFTLAAQDRDDAPDTLVVQAAAFDAMRFAAGAPVVAESGRVVLDRRVAVRLDGARPWIAWLPAYPADDARLRRNAARVAHALADRTDEAPSPLHAATAAALARRAHALGDALVRGEVDAVVRHARSLMGLGPGLTPAGDDLLLGMLAALAMPGGPARVLRGARGALLAGAGERTHAISLAALRAASAGRVRASIAALLDAMTAGAAAAVDAALASVLAIGATSGRDIADGLLRGLEVQRRLGCARRAAA